MSTRHEQWRADRLTDAQIRREDAAAAAQVQIAARTAAAQERRADEQARADRAAAQRHQRHQRRDARVAALRGWAAGRAVDLLIYPAVGIAFAMAGPSMALYGEQVYASRLGWLLPGISELLMLAFAVAVLVSRRRQPQRPVVMLQAGVWVFAALSAGLNFLHGWERGWSAGVVMALVAISGIVAHQLTLATPPRSVAERAEARIERMAARKIARVRRAAVRQAAAQLYPDGAARLVHTPGHYALTWDGRRLTPVTAPPGRQAPTTQPAAPVPEPVAEQPADPEPVTTLGGTVPTLRAVPAHRSEPAPTVRAEITPPGRPAPTPANRATGPTAQRPTGATPDSPPTEPRSGPQTSPQTGPQGGPRGGRRGMRRGGLCPGLRARHGGAPRGGARTRSSPTRSASSRTRTAAPHQPSTSSSSASGSVPGGPRACWPTWTPTPPTPPRRPPARWRRPGRPRPVRTVSREHPTRPRPQSRPGPGAAGGRRRWRAGSALPDQDR